MGRGSQETTGSGMAGLLGALGASPRQRQAAAVATAPAPSAPASPDGEIGFIDAERLDEQAARAAKGAIDEIEDPDFGDARDTEAINNIISSLSRTPSGARMSADEREDKAVDLYNAYSNLIRDGVADDERLEKIAALFGQDPAELKERLLA